ncbi:O-antigen ligase [Phenylobacterium aquaticum]|uniref:O-antigen ligase family protein n=1 Tax=Phenylobacterium aquaticum TaxID=1763816 RepID=UPI0026F0ABC5|nr:O-antigen ligase family protein [Phenylobacterium aquaticum]
MASDAALTPRGRLAAWTLVDAERRADQRAFADRWIGRLGGLALMATLLYLFIGSTPYVHEAVIDANTGGRVMNSVNRYSWIVLAGVSAPILWLRRQALPQALITLAPLLLLYGWFAATGLWALDAGASHRRLFIYLIELVICLSVSLSQPDGRRLHSVMAWTCAIMIGIDLFSWIFRYKVSMSELGLAGIHNHKNTLGAVMLICGLICWPYLMTQRSWAGRAFWLAVLAGGFALLVASLSKTSLGIYLGVFAFAPVLIWTLSTGPRTFRSILAAAVGLLTAVIFAYLAWCAVEALDPLAPIRGVTFTQRTDVWRFVIGEWSHHPWRGLGFGSFWDIDPMIQPSLQTDEWFAQPDSPTNEAHNGYLDILVTTGAIGLAAALGLLLWWTFAALAALRRALTSARPSDQAMRPYGIYQALLPLILIGHNVTESSYFAGNSVFGFLILLLGVELDLRRRQATA